MTTRTSRLTFPFVAAAILFALLPRTGAAQVAWDAPLLVPPRAAPGWGIFLVDPPGSDLALMGSWRRTDSMGFRLGIAEGRGDNDLSVYGGIDLSGGLLRRTAGDPFDLDWVLGGGLGVGDDLLLSFPVGITVGGTIAADGVVFGPYVTPRVVLDAWLGDDGPGDRDNLDLDVAVDLGLDIAFDPTWTLRFGATLGDREALAIGVGIR